MMKEKLYPFIISLAILAAAVALLATKIITPAEGLPFVTLVAGYWIRDATETVIASRNGAPPA